MSNSWYTRVKTFLAGTKARGSDVRSEFDLVVSAFDDMPAPHSGVPTTKGFADAIELESTLQVDGTTNLAGGLGANVSGASAYKLTSMVDGSATQDYATMANLAAEIAGGGSPDNIPITSLDVGTATADQFITINAGGAAVVGNDYLVLQALESLTPAANKVPYFTGATTAGLLDFLDEDSMSSDSTTAVSSQQSIKAYVDTTNFIRNLIINGNFDIWQRGTSFSPLADTDYAADRWSGWETSPQTWDVSRSTIVPDEGSEYSIYMEMPQEFIGGSETFALIYSMEGYDAQRLGYGDSDAKTATLSFWVRASAAGTYCIALQNSAIDRTYVSDYAVSSADTWEYKTITITGDTGGTWLKTTGLGLRILFSFAVGSELQTSNTDTWESVAAYRASVNIDNLTVGTAPNYAYLSRVQLEIGSNATTFEPRPIAEELSLCQRYFISLPSDGATATIDQGIANGTGRNTAAQAYFCFNLPVSMRASPTAAYNNAEMFDGVNTSTVDSIVTSYTGPGCGQALLIRGASGIVTSGESLILRVLSSTGYLSFDAEL